MNTAENVDKQAERAIQGLCGYGFFREVKASLFDYLEKKYKNRFKSVRCLFYAFTSLIGISGYAS